MYSTLKGEKGLLENESVYNNIIIRCTNTYKYFCIPFQKENFESLKYNNYEEVIIDELHGTKFMRKLYFDLDFPINYEGDVQKIIDDVIESIKAGLSRKYIYTDKFVIYTSSGEEYGRKESFHIIVKDVCGYQEDVKHFILNYIKPMVNEETLRIVDWSIYKTKQNFRMPYNTKNNSERIKTNKDEEFVLVRNYGEYDYQIIESSKKTQEEIFNFVDDKIIDFALDHIQNKEFSQPFEFHKYDKNTLFFKRIYSSYCEVCERTHDKDNTLAGNIFVDSNDNKKLRFFCWKSGKILYEYDEGYKFEQSTLLSNLMKTNYKEINPWDKLENYIYEDSQGMHDYFQSDKKVIGVKAQMGIGKTKALKNLVNDGSYVIVSFRRTLAFEQFKKFNEFQIYSDSKGQIQLDNTKIVIQCESLHRIIPGQSDKPEILILDEAESLLQQFNSGLHRKFYQSWAVFEWLIRNSKRIIALDANLGQASYTILSRLCGEHNMFFHHNYAKINRRNFYLTMKESHWLGKLKMNILEGKKVVITTNSLLDAESLAQFVDQFEVNYKVFSSKTTEQERKEVFSDIEKHWKLDVLIYTPTVSAGVSFEIKHFDVIYGLFSNQSCDVNSCLQMLNRVRDIKDNEVNILFKYMPSNLPETKEQIERNLQEQKEDLDVPFDYDNNGMMRIYKTNYYYLWLELKSVNNRSKNKFIKLFISKLLYDKHKVCEFDYIENTDSLTDCREEVKSIHANKVCSKNLISAEEAVELFEKKEICLDEKYILEKYLFCKFYNVRDVEPLVFLSFQNRKMKNIYVMLKEITEVEYEDFYKLKKPFYKQPLFYKMKLEEIYQKDKAFANITPGDIKSERRDLNWNYRWFKHALALSILWSLGFVSPFDEKTVSEEFIESVCNAIYENMYEGKNSEKLTIIMKTLKIKGKFNLLERIKRDTDIYIPKKSQKKILSFINSIINKFYGIKIKDGKIERCEILLFNIGDKVEEKPTIYLH